MLFHYRTDDEPDAREDDSDEPKAHNHRLLAPSDSFEVVMKWGDPKDLFTVPELLGGKLDDNGADLQNIDSGDDEQDRNSIGHKGHNPEVRAECERADIAHVELGGFYVEPEESNERPDDEHTDRREDEESAIVGDECVHDVVEEQKSARESVETVGDIDRIRHRDDDEYENRDIQESKMECSEEGDIEARVPEFDIEPVGPESCKYREQDHFDPSGESLGPSNPADIQVVIDHPDDSDSCKSKEGQIGFISVPETVLYLYTEYILDICREQVDDDGNSNQ